MARKGRRRPNTNVRVLGVILVSLIIVFLVGWRLWSCLYNVSPVFNFLLFQKNESLIKVLNGEVLHLHPKDTVKILKVSTNICFNHRVRLVSTGFDVNALSYQDMSFSTLLSGKDMLDHYEFRVNVKRDNDEMGYVDIVVEPLVQDWLDKADRTIDRTRRVALLEQALKMAPSNEQIRDRLIEEYKALKDWPKVAQMLEEMANKNPDQGTLHELLHAYEAMSKTDGIISVLRRLVMYDQTDVHVRLQLASVLEKSKRLNEAIVEYESILKLVRGQDQLPIYKSLGYLYTRTNQIEKAISNYLHAAELDQRDANLYYNLSSLYEKKGQQDKADSFLEKAVSLRIEDIDSQLVLAERLIDKGKWEEAEMHLNAALKRKPDTLKALLLLAGIAEKKGDKNKLKEIYERILSIDPKNETIIYNLGVLEYESNNLERSLSYFQRLVKAQPKDPDLHSFLFDIYRREKKDDLAFQEAQILVTLRPKEMAYYNYMFEYLSGQGDYHRIIRIMQDGLRSHPENVDLREYLILAYLKTDKEDLAVLQMEEVLKIKPKDVTLLLQLARLKEKQGKLQEALRTYEKIMAISPEHQGIKETYLGLLLEDAKLKEKQGQTREAMETYKKILDISPGLREAEEAYLRLRFKALEQ